MIPYGKQTINQDDINAVIHVLQSDFLTQGEQVPTFERTLREYCGAQYAVAVCNATAALHLACLALGVGKGDVVWTSPITFVASANCALYCGAEIDFVDIDPITLNMSMKALSDKLIQTKQQGKRLPKVVIPVHLCGEPCDMITLRTLANEYGFAIIEDASHAIGARYHHGKVGNGQYSDITVFSFHPVKIITTAEGGACLTNRADLAEKIMLLRSHGITRNPQHMTHAPDGTWYYQQIALGFNYRMTELQAALGTSQMHRLDEFVTRRHQLAHRYDKLLNHLPLQLPYRNPNYYSALHLYPIQVSHRQRVFDYLRQQHIGVNVHYIPVPSQPYYRQHFNLGIFPHAEHYYAHAISLPLYFDLQEEQQDEVVAHLQKALERQ